MKPSLVPHWMATVLRWMLSLSLVASGVASVALAQPIRATFHRLELPLYLALILGLAKIGGGLMLLAPPPLRTRALTEWAFAGTVFLFGGAVAVHVAGGDPFAELFAPGLLLLLALAAYAMERGQGKVGSRWQRP